MFEKLKIASLVVILPTLTACSVIYKAPEISSSEVEEERKLQIELTEKNLAKDTQVVANATWPLITKNMELCDRFTQYSTGLWLSREENVSFSLFRRSRIIGVDPFIWGVANGSPAEAAGLKPMDKVISIDNVEVLRSRKANKQLVTATDKFEDHERIRPINLRVQREGQTFDFEITPVKTCRSTVFVEGSSAINAYASGRDIAIYTGLLEFVESEEELQYVIAHELAHNMLKHVEKAVMRGVAGGALDLLLAAKGFWSRGFFSAFSVRAYSKRFEVEADYISLYLLAIADIDYLGVEDMWRRFATEHARLGWNMTHPAPPLRLLQMRSTIEEIDRKKKNGEPLLPERS